uniref:acyl-CoA synthetase n=1 Tax=Castellaniella defragrans TaxID=75697 RepID=UPI00333E9007
MGNIFEQDLPRTPANFAPLTPLLFLERAAEIYPGRLAVVHGLGERTIRYTWAQLHARCLRLASALAARGLGRGDTVAAMLPNTPAMVEAHFGVPMSGAVLNTLNTRLDPAAIAFMLDHGEARMVIVDTEFSEVMRKALALRQSARPIEVVVVSDPIYEGGGAVLDGTAYEDLLAGGDESWAWRMPEDEWDAIALNYTSGTTGNPKGVVYHHRGAAINAVSNVLEWDMPKHAVYLWTLPMFHCNGWCFPWTVAARAGVNVCLRRVDAQTMISLMREHGVTHYCGAPIVHSMLVNASEALRALIPPGIRAMVAGAAPPASMIEGMESLGINLTHVYGLTETYGPSTVCAKHETWDALDIGRRAELNARQGVRSHLQHAVTVRNPETLEAVPADGQTMGEIMFRGNICMKGYLKNPEATRAALGGGWFHSGDLAVTYPDGYIQIKDRSKDIIISGGENISSIEVEDVLYRHPAVLAAAVVARSDPRWGETPCAFVEIKEGASVTAEDIIQHCKRHLAGYKTPRMVIFGELPKTSTGKIQKYELRKRAADAQ